eukprot:11710905-Ditylum_brightwellii.AAC.1
MVEDLHQALADVETSLAVLLDALGEEYFNKYDAFLASRVIPTYGTTYRYTEHITSDVLNIINENEKKFTTPPNNAWNRGPPK